MFRACGVDVYGHTGACISWAYIQDESIGVRPALYIQL